MTCRLPLLRVQDRYGRGPFRPGLSKFWLDDSEKSLDLLPTVMDDFGEEFYRVVGQACALGLHVGTAVEGWKMLDRWFTEKECFRLAVMGFRIADASQLKRLLISKNQILVSWHLPLSMLPDARRMNGEVEMREAYHDT